MTFIASVVLPIPPGSAMLIGAVLVVTECATRRSISLLRLWKTACLAGSSSIGRGYQLNQVSKTHDHFYLRICIFRMPRPKDDSMCIYLKYLRRIHGRLPGANHLNSCASSVNCCGNTVFPHSVLLSIIFIILETGSRNIVRKNIESLLANYSLRPHLTRQLVVNCSHCRVTNFPQQSGCSLSKYGPLAKAALFSAENGKTRVDH